MVMYVDSPDAETEARDAFEERIRRSEMPRAIRAEAIRQLSRLAVLPKDTFEHYLIRGYLEAVLELPWSDRMAAERRMLGTMLSECPDGDGPGSLRHGSVAVRRFE
jgi:ATP-dependent Lon protease